jgi:hypothetical protein
MARHVFQYDRMSPKLGLFLGDPYLVPPLPPRPDEEAGEGGARGGDRPVRADQAGLTWTYDGAHPDARDNTGRAHRQEEILQRQRNDLINNPNNNNNNNPNGSNKLNPNANLDKTNFTGLPIVTATATTVPSAPSPASYRRDGTKI